MNDYKKKNINYDFGLFDYILTQISKPEHFFFRKIKHALKMLYESENKMSKPQLIRNKEGMKEREREKEWKEE